MAVWLRLARLLSARGLIRSRTTSKKKGEKKEKAAPKKRASKKDKEAAAGGTKRSRAATEASSPSPSVSASADAPPAKRIKVDAPAAAASTTTSSASSSSSSASSAALPFKIDKDKQVSDKDGIAFVLFFFPPCVCSVRGARPQRAFTCFPPFSPPAKAMILQYLTAQNRPYSHTQVWENLHRCVKKLSVRLRFLPSRLDPRCIDADCKPCRCQKSWKHWRKKVRAFAHPPPAALALALSWTRVFLS
jgi:hypothetical protein